MLTRLGAWIVSHVAAVMIGVFLVVAGMTALVASRCGPPPNTVVVTPPATEHSARVTHITNPTAEQQALLEAQAREAKLMDELKQLRSSLQTITRAIATLQTSGSGAFVPVPGPPGQQGPPGTPGASVPTPASSTHYQFKDWRLAVDADLANQTMKYTLTQRFEAHHITGRQPNGTPTSLFTMFELGPGDTKTPVPAVVTTTVVDQAREHWFLSPTVQAGFGVDVAAALPLTRTTGAIVSLQLLKRGKTPAAEDCRLAILAPAVVISGGKVALGVIPIGVNLGNLWTRQPLRDLWANPYLARDSATGKIKLGVGLSASF